MWVPRCWLVCVSFVLVFFPQPGVFSPTKDGECTYTPLEAVTRTLHFVNELHFGFLVKCDQAPPTFTMTMTHDRHPQQQHFKFTWRPDEKNYLLSTGLAEQSVTVSSAAGWKTWRMWVNEKDELKLSFQDNPQTLRPSLKAPRNVCLSLTVTTTAVDPITTRFCRDEQNKCSETPATTPAPPPPPPPTTTPAPPPPPQPTTTPAPPPPPPPTTTSEPQPPPASTTSPPLTSTKPPPPPVTSTVPPPPPVTSTVPPPPPPSTTTPSTPDPPPIGRPTNPVDNGSGARLHSFFSLAISLLASLLWTLQ